MNSRLSNAPTTNGQAPAIKTVTGQYIARATVSYPPRRRAEDAARWLRGELHIKPTTKLAAETFRVSAPLLKQARDRLEHRERGKRHANGNGATALSDSAIDNIVAELGPERVMCSLDRITLPLVAAE